MAACLYKIYCYRCGNKFPFFESERDSKFSRYCHICKTEKENIWEITLEHEIQIEEIQSLSDTKDKKLWTLGTRKNRKCCHCKTKNSDWFDGDCDLKIYYVFAPHPSHILCKQCFSVKLESEYEQKYKYHSCKCGLPDYLVGQKAYALKKREVLKKIELKKKLKSNVNV